MFDDLVPLTTVTSYLEAELLCQRLEFEGIPATYLGRSTASGPAIPTIGAATVQIRGCDSERAAAVLHEAGGR